MMIPQPRPLIEVFADLPDVRRSRGTRHPCYAMLALAWCAMGCGDRSEGALAAWGRHEGTQRAHALGFPHHTPCAATLCTIFGHVDREALAATLGAWADSVGAHTPAAETREDAMAVDGTTLRGSKQQGAPGTHGFSVCSHRRGRTLTHQAVDVTTTAIKAIATVLAQSVRHGRVRTLEALRTPRQVAQTMGAKGGDAGRIVTEHQPQRTADRALMCPVPPAGDRQERVRTVEVGQGRVETRHLTTSAAWVGYSDGPGRAHVVELGRHVITKQTGKERVDVV